MYPCKTPVLLYKNGLRGSESYRYVFMMVYSPIYRCVVKESGKSVYRHITVVFKLKYVCLAAVYCGVAPVISLPVLQHSAGFILFSLESLCPF